MTHRVGLISGTFDPIHHGHVALAQEALQALCLDEVWVLIDADPQHKTVRTSFDHRLAMAGLALAEHANVHANVHPLQRRAERRTIESARRLQQSDPDTAFTLIMGLDTFKTLEHWESIHELCALMSFGVVARHGTGADQINDHAQHLIRIGLPLRYQYVPMKPVPQASSALRAAILGKLQPTGIHENVLDYIREHNIYQ